MAMQATFQQLATDPEICLASTCDSSDDAEHNRHNRSRCWSQQVLKHGRRASVVACGLLALGSLCTPPVLLVAHGHSRRAGLEITGLAAPIPVQRSSAPEGPGEPAATKADHDAGVWGGLGYNVTKNYYESAFIPVPEFASKPDKWPSLFCWLLMQTIGRNPMGWSEEKLVKHQLTHGIGIFECNDWAVMTDVPVALNRWGARGFPIIPNGKPNPYVDMASWAIGDTQATKGVQTNPLNSVVFRNAWYALRASKKIHKHEWVVKVDPDTVWFPERLRTHLQAYLPGHGNGWDNVFLKNCQRFNTMQGPIEVISKIAGMKIEQQIEQCAGVYGSGEDQFIVKCMEGMGIYGHMEHTLLLDQYCNGYVDCADTWTVAFHPHKGLSDFDNCHNRSLQAEMDKITR